MSTSTHVNVYIQEVEAKYKEALTHLDAFKTAVDQLRTTYEALIHKQETPVQAVEALVADAKEDIKNDTSSKKK